MNTILILSGSLLPTQAGSAHSTLDFSNYLATIDGLNVDLYTSEVDLNMVNSRLKVVKYMPFGSLPFFWRFDGFSRYMVALKEFKKYDFSDIHLCYTRSNIFALAFRRLYPRIPIVSHYGWITSSREYQEENLEISNWYKKANSWLYDWFEARSYTMSNWVHIVSTPLVAEERTVHFKLPANFFNICPLAVDVERFVPMPSDDIVRERLMIDNKNVILLAVCRLVKWKNLNMVLRVLKRLERPDVFFVIVGKGEEKKGLQRESIELGISSQLRFIGHVDDPRPYYSISDIFVLPSSIETFGIAYAEAMAMGLPCIGLKYNPPKVLSSAMDVIPDGKAGFCVSNEAQLLDSLNFLINDTELRKRMGTYARNLARSKYCWEHYTNNFISLIKKHFGITV